jgi:hypothetical protein
MFNCVLENLHNKLNKQQTTTCIQYTPVIRNSQKRKLVYSEQLFLTPAKRLLFLVNWDIRKLVHSQSINQTINQSMKKSTVDLYLSESVDIFLSDDPASDKVHVHNERQVEPGRVQGYIRVQTLGSQVTAF